jgi:two-component system response regulator RegA
MDDRVSLLIVEDDEPLRNRLVKAFDKRGYDVRATATAAEATRLAADDPPELVLVDLRIGADNGLDLITAHRRVDGLRQRRHGDRSAEAWRGALPHQAGGRR